MKKGSRFTPKKVDLPPKPEPIKPFYLGRMIREHGGREWEPQIPDERTA